MKNGDFFTKINTTTTQLIFLYSYLVISEVFGEVLLKFSSQCRPCDHTLGNPFFKIPFSSHAYVRVTYERTKGNSPEDIT